MTFEQFIEQSEAFKHLLYVEGTRNLFMKDHVGVYKLQPVRLAHAVWEYKHSEVPRALTQKELDLEEIWAERFEDWWENEGQYHRAGGNDYCKTFAWYAWLSQQKEINKQGDEHLEYFDRVLEQSVKYTDEIDQLKTELNNMEACYIEKKQECENLLTLNQGHELRHQINLGIKKNLNKKIINLQTRVNAATSSLETNLISLNNSAEDTWALEDALEILRGVNDT